MPGGALHVVGKGSDNQEVNVCGAQATTLKFDFHFLGRQAPAQEVQGSLEGPAPTGQFHVFLPAPSGRLIIIP